MTFSFTLTPEVHFNHGAALKRVCQIFRLMAVRIEDAEITSIEKQSDGNYKYQVRIDEEPPCE